ncbi:MAG: diaminopimelate epimerase [Ignavibacteria bacterium]|nr:diaminopimelate epimerase [Ignavibacteria bacterium]
MVHTIPFLKVSGAGNDFVLLDNMASELSLDWPSLARVVSPRRSGIGADGLLVLEPSERASFRMLYFNADGSFGGMCGNGGRCAARYAVERGIAGTSLTFEACGSLYQAEVMSSGVRLGMNDIAQISPPTEFRLDETRFTGWILDTGSPHVVIEANDLDEIQVDTIGRAIRHHELVSSHGGANVNFVSTIAGKSLRIRTYERGVEAETLACGTGAVAAAAVAVSRQRVTAPVPVRVQSGEDLHVSLQRKETGFTAVRLEGSAHFLFAGTFQLSGGGKLLVDTPVEQVGPKG